MQIAAILCVAEPVVSRMVRALERLGWVERRLDPRDRRCKIVSLSEAGRQRLAPHLDADYHLDPSGQRSAQCDGEVTWIGDWERPMQRVGLSLDEFFLPHVADGLFREMQLWNKRNSYNAVFDWWSRYTAHPPPNE